MYQHVPIYVGQDVNNSIYHVYTFHLLLEHTYTQLILKASLSKHALNYICSVQAVYTVSTKNTLLHWQYSPSWINHEVPSKNIYVLYKLQVHKHRNQGARKSMVLPKIAKMELATLKNPKKKWLLVHTYIHCPGLAPSQMCIIIT